MRGVAASALIGYNKDRDLHRMNSARTSGDVIDVRSGNFDLCHVQSSQFPRELEAASCEDPANLCWFSGCVEDMNIFSASGSSTVVGQFKKHVHIF